MSTTQPSLSVWILSCLRPHHARVTLLAALSTVEIALGALQPWPLKAVVDNVLGGRPFPEPLDGMARSLTGGDGVRLLFLVVGAGLAVQILNQIVSMLHTQVQVDAGQRLVLDLRSKLFTHLQALSLRHHTSHPIGDAVFRIEVDAYCVQNLVMTGVFPLASSVVTLIVMFVVLLLLDPVVALLSLTVMPFLYACLRYYTSHIVDRAERVKELESRIVERLYETFAAIKLVKGFARERRELERFTGDAKRAMDGRLTLTWKESLFSAAVGTITMTGTAMILVVGGWRVLEGHLTIGSLLVVIAYLASVFGPLSSIAHTTGQLQEAVASARRVRASLAERPEVMEAPDGRTAADIKGDVRFDEVSFAYGDRAPVVEHISFTARRGQTVAIVGLTGAGKSTLVSLIPRFYDPTHGQVLVDERDVREYRLRSLRQRVALVLQDSQLFAGSIADNLRYGRLDATDGEVEAAARAAYAHDFIMRLPKGYQTEVAEAGAGLSGGERQRLGIARALLKDAPILILDEPTSALDAISEAAVFQALRTLREGRTTIVIAHRLSTIRDADAILVLDQGRIAARGTHDELLGSNELYQQLCARLGMGATTPDAEPVDDAFETARS